MSRGGQINFGWVVGIVIVKVDIKQEGTMAVGGTICTHDHRLHKVDTVLVASDVHCIGMLKGQGSGNIGQFLCKPDHLDLIGGIIGIKVGGVVVLDLGG